jgi:nucleotide-binding universal stress UspA family protein
MTRMIQDHPEAFPIGTILVPVDFSECSSRAFGYGVRLARAFGSRILLLHVFDSRIIENVFHIHQMDEEDVRKEMAGRAKKAFDALRADPEAEGIEMDSVERAGIPAREIVEAAKDLDADLIVIGAHGATGLQGILYGTTAEGVVRTAPCPVLSVGDRSAT